MAEEFDAKMDSVRKSIATDPKSAVKELRGLLAVIDRHTFLDHERPQMTTLLGHALLAAGDPKAAIGAFEQRLRMEKEDCADTADYPASCASALLNLGTAKMYAGETEAAVEIMHSSVEKFRLQIKREEPREARELQHFVHLRKLGEAELLYGIFLSRSGKPTEAREALDGCIATSRQILAEPEVQESLRTDAQRFIDQASKQRSSLK